MQEMKGVPVLGMLPELRRGVLGLIKRAQREHGDIVRVRLGPRTAVVLSHPALAREALIERKHVIQRSNLFEGGTPLTYILGLSLITTDGESWLAKRRTMQPVFHRARIAGMAAQMIDAGEHMLNQWQSLAERGAPVDLATQMKWVTLDIINRTMFSSHVLPQADRIGHVVETSLDYIGDRIRRPFQLPASWPLPKNRAFRAERAKLDEYLFGMIRDRRANPDQHDDLLEMLLGARDEETGLGMNDQQIRDEVTGIYGAGHETTAVALTWTWHCLNHNPAALARLHAELDSVLQGRRPQPGDLPNLPYTLAVFEESMRLFPPVPITARMAYEESELGGHPIRKGELVFIAIDNIHQHPVFWPQPEMFKPERFLPENKRTLDRSAYLPFLSGPHMCIGNHFALMEGQLLLAMMAQRFEVSELPNQIVTRHVAITMRPAHGLQVTLRKR